MNLKSTGLITAALLGVLALPTFAQERVVDADAARPAGDEAGLYRASELIGMEVRGKDNEDLGKVKDLFVDRQTNQIEYLILDTASFVDLQGQMPVVPWSIVQWHPGANANAFNLFVPLTQARIRTAPMIALTAGALTGIPQLRTQVNQFYSADLRQRRAARPDLNRSQDESAPNRNDTRNPASRPQSEKAAPGTRSPAGSKETPASTAKPEAKPNASSPSKPSQGTPKPEANANPDNPRPKSSTETPEEPAPKKAANP